MNRFGAVLSFFMLMTGVVYADSSTSKPSINVGAQTLQL